MRVEKRDGTLQEVSFDKVIRRIKTKCLDEPPCLKVDYITVAQKVIQRIYDTVKTRELDELAANILISISTIEPEYAVVAGRIIISNNHKNTSKSFSEVVYSLYNLNNQIISNVVYNTVQRYGDRIDKFIDYNRDYSLSYFGYKVCEGSYLKRINDLVVERPQHMLMRVALGVNMTEDLTEKELLEAFETYDANSKKLMTLSTPIMFNAGTVEQSMLSCFLIGNMDDSIKGIYKTLADCADISKAAGGLGINIQNIRSKGTNIHGNNGKSQGLIPMLRVFNDTALYVNQCFVPDTTIYTQYGPKRACHIKLEDKVITLDGSYRPVLQIITNKVDKDILCFKTNYSLKPVKCTPEHQIYCIRTPNPKLSVKSVLELDPIKEYVSASEIKRGDLVAYPVNNGLCNEISVSDDYLRFYGIWLSAGYEGKSYMSINTNIKLEFDYIRDFIKSYLTGHNIKYVEQRRNHKKDVKIRWEVASVFRDSDRNRTTINPKYFDIGRRQTQLILDGIVMPLTRQTAENNRNINIKVDNYNLVLQLKQLYLKTGQLIKGYKNGQNKWIVNVPKHNSGDYVQLDNIIWTRIKTINTEHYKGDVYDFNIEDNHNYLTDMGIVHNSGRRNGSFAVYCEPSHPDFMDFLEIKKNHGNEAYRCRDLFYAVWMPDLFMERVKNGEMWSFMDPHECPGLNDLYGDEYRAKYLEYERDKRYKNRLPAIDIWHKILEAQIETGAPYICYKDAINKKTNHKHLGTIKTSNLCAEIAEYSDDKEYACCTLSSIGLPAFVTKDRKFDFQELVRVVKIVVRNLNKIIDINHYPVPETEISNKRHRPIGVGVQGLADVYMLMRYPFDSEEAAQLNREIFATIYWAAMTASLEVAQEFALREPVNQWDMVARAKYLANGRTYLGAYSTFEGSPLSQGIFQFDMWGVTPIKSVPGIEFNWQELKEKVMWYGVRNSLLVAPMPTASTSQILGYNECFEPITSNIYTRNVLAGEFIVVNKYLIQDLQELGMWDKTMKDRIILAEGSIQQIEDIPKHIRDLYKTSYDLSMKPLINQAADRGAYICQTQSLNLFMSNPTFAKLTSMHFYAWDKGLKTGIYYLRTKSVGKAQQFTIDPTLTLEKGDKEPIKVCRRDDPSCMMCSS